MEPERKIEKLLRAFAKKRRFEAGEPLKLDPAARRILLDEIARRKVKPEEDDSLSLWQLFREHWAFLLGFALVMFCLATMFLPALSSAKRKAQDITAMNDLRQIGQAAQMAAAEAKGKLPASLEALTNELGSDQPLIDPQSGRPFIYAAEGKNLDTLRTDAVLAYSPEDKNGRAVLLADGSVEYATRTRFAELTNQATGDLAMAKEADREALPTAAIAGAATMNQNLPPAQPPAQIEGEISAPAPVASPPPAKTDSIQFGAGTSPSFDRKKAGSLPNLFKNNSNAASTAMSLVLARFQMEQNGGNLRVVDADGSVYGGAWQPTKVTAQNSPEQAQINSNPGLPIQTTAETPPQTFVQRLVANNVAQMIGQNYLFQVTGTNRTLGQNVVFTGVLTVVAVAPMAQGPAESAGGNYQANNEKQQNTAAYPDKFIWSNARIAGTAIVGETNQIEINASLP